MCDIKIKSHTNRTLSIYLLFRSLTLLLCYLQEITTFMHNKIRIIVFLSANSCVTVSLLLHLGHILPKYSPFRYIPNRLHPASALHYPRKNRSLANKPYFCFYLYTHSCLKGFFIEDET